MKVVIDIPDDWERRIKCNIRPNTIECGELVESIWKGKMLPKGHGRKFEKIVVDYPSPAICTYPEYRGKPYFSIQYEENGEHFIGYGTYNPDVLSQYLREYFTAQTTEEDNEV